MTLQDSPQSPWAFWLSSDHHAYFNAFTPPLTAGVHIHSSTILNPPPGALISLWSPKGRTPAFICDSLSFIPPSQNCEFPLFNRPQRQSSKGKHLDSRTIASFWASSASAAFLPSPLWAPAFSLAVTMTHSTSQLSGFLLSSRILGPCSHLPGKSSFYHPCVFWREGLSPLGIFDSFLYSCFLDPFWKDLSSSTASGQGTKRFLLNMQTLQPVL